MRGLEVRHGREIRNRRLRALGLAAIFVAMLAGRAAAQSVGLPLSIDIEPASYLSRTTGPLPLHLRLRWSGRDLLNGRLRIHVLDDAVRSYTFVSDELVLSTGDTRSSWLLPNVNRVSGIGQIDLEFEWLVDGDVAWQSRIPLRVPGEIRRTFVIGVVSGPTEPGPRIQNLVPRLSAEEVIRLGQDRPPEERPLMTLSPTIPVAELSSEPLSLCIYDVLLFDESALRGLSNAQRQGVAAWIRAGGGLVVVGEETAWRDAEIEFLRQLVGESPDMVLLARDGGGLTVTADEGLLSIAQSRLGLGRVVVVANPDELERDRELRRDVNGFLWNLRLDKVDDPFDESLPSNVNSGVYGYQDPLINQMANRTAMRHPQPPDMSALVDDLMPRGVRVVPLWLIAAVLAGYVLLIGPVDFAMLGWIRRRKWTWITFPIMTGLVAFGATQVTRTYVKARGPQREIRFVDVTSGGRVGRDSRLTLLFAATPEEVITRSSRGLFGAYRNEQMDRGRMYAMQMGFPVDESTEEQSTPIIDGRLPHSVVIRQDLPQWSPRLNHTLTIPLPGETPDADAAKFDWDAAAGFLDEPQPIERAIRNAYGPSVTGYLYRGTNRQTLLGQSQLFGPRGYESQFVTVPIRVGNQTIRQRIQVPSPPDASGNSQRDLLDRTTARREGILQYVSRVAPAGDLALEDLALLDSSDPNQAVLLIAVPTEAGWTIYRRLYFRDGGTWR